MAQKKAHEVDAWLSRPDPLCSVVLIYGPDRGLVSERAALFAKSAAFPLDDPFSVVRLSGEDADRDPGRIVDEMRTIPMFADRRLVWLRGTSGGKTIVDAVKALGDADAGSAVLLIEAGDLKKGAPLRALVEGLGAAMALPCYVDEAKTLDRLIDQALAAANMGISLEARQALKRNLGGDRLASRNEIDKVVLYARGDAQITLDHVEALSGDASGPSTDSAIDAVLLGRIDDFDRAFARLASANQLVPLLNALLRQFHTLEVMREDVESGTKTAASAVASARPPIFFARRELVERAIGRWPSSAIRRAQSRLHAVVLQSRERAPLAVPLIRQAMLGLAVESARRASMS